MFEGDELAAALGVPFFYGLVEAVLLGIYCIVAWKVGWTKAPKNVSIWKALSTSYEIVTAEQKGTAILSDQELSSATLPTTVEDEDDKSDDDDDGFHYVQHSDAEEPSVAPSDEESARMESIRQQEAKAPLVANSGSADK